MSDVIVEKRNAALWVTFNRPEVFNSLSPQAMCILLDMWEQATNDNSVAVVVLTGAGDTAFSSGADLKLTIPLLSGAKKPETTFDHRLLDTPDFIASLMLRNRTFCKPVIAAINGTAMAGGCEMVLASDIRIASSNATLALSEPKVGIVPGGGSMARLPRHVPWCQAMEFLLTGDAISADRAAEIGLINRVVALEDLYSEVDKLVATLLQNAPLALQAIKRTAIESSGIDLDKAFAIETRETNRVLASEDAREGPRAFAEKRQPVYRGQ